MRWHTGGFDSVKSAAEPKRREKNHARGSWVARQYIGGVVSPLLFEVRWVDFLWPLIKGVQIVSPSLIWTIFFSYWA